ncbi:zinc-finger homeodomain protein 2 [Prunus persica]|uniref:zinc-finger homeodomain protein 2 n=1 Tax=Prunus persica TaxID=3760 RepID=UPI0002C22A23|nr:zinc-finger homeodomain protein 2 [Prunus persica]XP_020414808.1 zinc-finger homeodomain protein 2 [Prunus persica]
MEFEEHEEHEEEMEMEMQPAPPGYDSAGASSRAKMGPAREGTVSTARKRGPTATAAITNTTTTLTTMVRYRECLKNHAVSIGGHAVDGCCEFLAAGDEGTMDALICAACNCHRNFHRKEPEGELIHHHQGGTTGPYHQSGGSHHHLLQHQFSSAFYRPPPPPSGYLITSPHARPTLTLPAASGGGGGSHSRDDGEDVSNPSSSGGGGGGGGGFGINKKRHRTKFTQEQKEKMLEFAEKVGWRIQKHDEAAVEEFCGETGVKRQVLKVWMHNNKHTLGKKLGP